MLESVIIIILIFSIIIIALVKFPQKKSDSSFNDVMKRYEENLITLNNDIQSFKEPMGKLRNFLSGSTSVGSFGEWNLKSILEDIFTNDQYIENVEIIPNSGMQVEFAVKLQDGLLMPIDAKFPSGLYDKYLKAAENLDKKAIDESEKEIIRHLKKESKSISSKYVLEGVTTDYAILYLPSESLFQLVMKLNIKEKILKEDRILILGPNSLAAYIISLQMGFRTLTLNKRTSEIIKEFGIFKREFERFSNSTEELRKKAQTMTKVIDEHEIREKQMSRSIERMEKFQDED